MRPKGNRQKSTFRNHQFWQDILIKRGKANTTVMKGGFVGKEKSVFAKALKIE